jgi:hypothetical protein
MPATPTDLARSLILSSDFQLDSLGLPKSDEDLQTLSAAIAAGRRDAIAPREVQVVEVFLATAKDFQRRWSLPRVVLLWILPVLLLLGFVAYLFKIILSG